MITVYRYKGKFGEVPSDYIPCLIATADDVTLEGYFETMCEIEAADISDHRQSKWFSGPTRLISVRFWAVSGQELGYVLADELMTSGVEL